VSPRSAEYFDVARRRLAGARAAVDVDPSFALAGAYYAMLNAAHGALSEEDVHSRTHRGTWHLLRERFGETGRLPLELVARVQAVQLEREDADYQAWLAPREEAERVIALATEFLAVVEAAIA